jgi:hypothetical protein
MALGEALRGGDDRLAEDLRRFELPQMKMGVHLRDYGIRAGNRSQFPASRFEQAYADRP